MHSLPQISYTRNRRLYRPADKTQPILSLSLSACPNHGVQQYQEFILAKPTEPEFTRNRNPTVLELTWCSVGGAHQKAVVVLCSADARCAQQHAYASRAVRDRRREFMYSNLQQRNSAGFIKGFYFPVITHPIVPIVIHVLYVRGLIYLYSSHCRVHIVEEDNYNFTWYHVKVSNATISSIQLTVL